MLLSNKSSPTSMWSRLWNFTKSYATNVFHIYVDFVGPLMLIMVASQVHVSQDKERFGLGWLYYTSLKDDRVREEKFPAYEPTSKLERRRMEAANAVEYAASAM